MKKSGMAIAALLAACNTTPPQFLPPPFGPEGPQPARLFFPTGLVQAPGPDAGLLIANGNFDRLFETGTVVNLTRSYLDSRFLPDAGPLDCDVPDASLDCTQPIPGDTSAAMIGSYAGPLVLNADAGIVYSASRDNGSLNEVAIGANGKLHCTENSGGVSSQDCRNGVRTLDLPDAGVDGPFTVVAGNTFLPGESTPKDVFFISSIVPHIDSISSGVITSSTHVAVVDMLALAASAPSPLLYSMRAGSQFVGGGTGVGPMVFDGVRRQLYLAGCYVRSSALGAGEPGSTLCGGISTNYLRILGVDARDATDPTLIDLRSDVLSIYTVQLMLGDPDPATKAPQTLWATMRLPDTLVRIELPTSPSVLPRVRKVIPLPISPADMTRIPRPGAPDLIAVVAEKQNSVVIVDTTTDEVVAEVGRLGDSPFLVKQIDCPAAARFSNSACLATTVFGACRVALIEVPLLSPSQAKLRALAGTCP